MELAHIMLGHHIDTRYAFNDRLLFPDESTFQRISMFHSDAANEAAAKTAMAYIAELDVQRQPSECGAVLRAVGDRAKALKALNSARLGGLAPQGRRHALDERPEEDGSPSELGRLNPKGRIAIGELDQVDPWDDTVHIAATKMYAYLNPSDERCPSR